MPPMRPGLAALLTGLLILASPPQSPAQGPPGAALTGTPEGFTALASGVWVQPIGTYSVERLNAVLTTERQEFATFPQEFPPAKYPVALFRVRYRSVVPEWDNRPTIASGLVAIPQMGQAEGATLPVVSYQHGTVFGKDQVPSRPDQSYETRLVLAQFAGQGYAVIAADYFGRGDSTEPDSYLVRDSTRQACLDMLLAGRAVLTAEHVEPGALFLSGWSQGAWCTMSFLNKLEALEIPVTAAATAAAFNDVYATTQRWLNAPEPTDDVFLPGILAIQLHAYQAYYRLPGLVESAIQPAYLAASRQLATGDTGWTEFRAATPPTLREFIRPEFLAAGDAATARYWQILQADPGHRWRLRTPLRTYYGAADRACPPAIAQLPATYQPILGGAAVTAVPAGADADHRGAFLFAVAHQKTWFDELRARQP